jgi:hypothetical protein
VALAAITVGEWIGVATGVVGVGTLVLTYRLIRHGIVQIEGTRRSIEAGIAAEVRVLNSACKPQRRKVMQAFPLHVDLVREYGPHMWEIRVDGQRLPDEAERSVVRWLELSSHPSARTWDDVGDLTDEELEDASDDRSSLSCSHASVSRGGRRSIDQGRQPRPQRAPACRRCTSGITRVPSERISWWYC